MKIFATADTHINKKNSNVFQLLKKYIEQTNPDVVVIAGDVYDYRELDPNEEFNQLGLPVIYCLGNHEFAYRSIEETHLIYSSSIYQKNVFCLDTVGRVDINDVSFIGNVLWYDGSLSNRRDKEEYLNKISPYWLDHTIRNFNPIKEYNTCVEQIKYEYKKSKKQIVLVTHMVPLKELNLFNYSEPDGWPNIYSGVNDLFKENNLYVNVSICGHTHRKTNVGYQINDNFTRCYNIGNDYYSRTNELIYNIIEI